MREARWRAAQLDRHVRANRGRLLDVGCSAGSFLLAARDRGWDVHGIDISPAAVDHALDVLGLGATLATLEDAPFPHESFDVITLFECIEHLPHPTRALLSASRLLRPDGLLVITTPNIDGFVPRSTYQLLARTIGAWEHPTPPHHLYQFSRRTLTALLRKTGFEVLAYATRPMGLKFTVKQMESAVVEACKRRLPLGNRAAAAGRPDPRALKKAAPRGSIAKRGARALVSSLCWSLTAALYAVPIHWMGAGDSMLVVASKAR